MTTTTEETRVMSTPTEIQEARQGHRDDFTRQLRKSYPDPASSVRQQCEPLLDRWWPGTQETTDA